MNKLKQLWAILRERCPRCRKGRIFNRLFQMNDPCPVCGLVERAKSNEPLADGIVTAEARVLNERRLARG